MNLLPTSVTYLMLERSKYKVVTALVTCLMRAKGMGHECSPQLGAPGVPGGRCVVKDSPHPHEPSAFGLWKTNSEVKSSCTTCVRAAELRAGRHALNSRACGACKAPYVILFLELMTIERGSERVANSWPRLS